MPKIAIKPPGVPKRRTEKSHSYYWWALVILLSVVSAIFLGPYAIQKASEWSASPDIDEGKFYSDQKSLPERTIRLKVPDRKLATINWDVEDMEEIALKIVNDGVPIVIKNVSRRSFEIFHLDLMKMAQSKRAFYLNASKWQNSPVFIESHERERGGMIGGRNDKHTLYSNITLMDFLRSTMNPNSYFSWSGGLSSWEAQLSPKRMIHLASGSPIFQRSQVDNGFGSEPAVHLSHPGVVTQTNFDTVNSFLLQVLGTKKVLLFEHSIEMHPYPNIHRSYSFSQLFLENGKDDFESFPAVENLSPIEVLLSPGDMLYIPAYWFHRDESVTLSLSLTMHSISAIEEALSVVYDKTLPLGFAKDDRSTRLAVAEIYLRLISKDQPESYEEFLYRLYLSRYRPLFPPTYFMSIAESNLHQLLCPIKVSAQDSVMSAEQVVEAITNKHEIIRPYLADFLRVAEDSRIELQKIETSNEVLKGFIYDFTEELVRWAVGPDKVAVYIYKCSSASLTVVQ